jgi:hypothetical protein
VTVSRDGRWQARVPVGHTPALGINGLRVRLSLVLADATVDAAFQQYNVTAANARHPGISPVPAVTRLDAVEILLDLPPVIL